MIGARTVRRAALAVAVVAAAGFAAIRPDIVKGYYNDLYPVDPAKRQALDLCFMQDHKFNRLDPDERDACYRHILYSVGDTAAGGSVKPDANPIDLQRAAGQTSNSMPKNDIRRLQQTENTIHTPH
jgi:hypothetical protein